MGSSAMGDTVVFKLYTSSLYLLQFHLEEEVEQLLLFLYALLTQRKRVQEVVFCWGVGMGGTYIKQG